MLDIFRIADETELTDNVLMDYIRKNDSKTNLRYKRLADAYNNNYKIFHMEKKAPYKPDNRLSVNLAQYIVDTFEGFFMGNEVKITCEDETIAETFNDIDDSYDGADINAELSTIVSIFGRGYRIAYVDEDGEIGSAYLDPMESFAIYSDSITPKMRYFVRTYVDSSKQRTRRGSISDDTTVRYFHMNGGTLVWDEEYPHGFDGVPAVEFVMNRQRRGIFESVLNLIDAYNKALSEKANDVDYFADAYLKVLGAKIDKATIRFMRENRTINIPGNNGAGVIVDFLQKPSSDTTQENLLNRIERMIFTVAMVCNISEDNFATSSGIALKYKMLPMINLAAKKWRKFSAGLKQYYKLLCSNPVTPLNEDDWQSLNLIHTLNYPANVADEAGTASALSGITSKKTQLSVLSIVDDVDAEIEQIKNEAIESIEFETEYETKRTENETDEGAEKGANENDVD